MYLNKFKEKLWNLFELKRILTHQVLNKWESMAKKSLTRPQLPSDPKWKKKMRTKNNRI